MLGARRASVRMLLPYSACAFAHLVRQIPTLTTPFMTLFATAPSMAPAATSGYMSFVRGATGELIGLDSTLTIGSMLKSSGPKSGGERALTNPPLPEATEILRPLPSIWPSARSLRPTASSHCKFSSLEVCIEVVALTALTLALAAAMVVDVFVERGCDEEVVGR